MALNSEAFDLTGTEVRAGNLTTDGTITATVGAVTINKASGNALMSAGASTVVVTNSLVTANSVVLVTQVTNDGTARLLRVLPAAGSFTITSTANATGNTEYRWTVINLVP